MLGRVQDLEVKLGNYTMTDIFYVVNLSNTNVVLGIQLLYSLGEVGFNYQTLTMSFKDTKGSKVVLRGMSIGAPRTVSAKRMENFHAWRCGICCRLFDHHQEGFR